MKEIVKPIIGNHVAAHDRFPHVPTQAAHLGYGGLGVLVDGPGDDGVLQGPHDLVEEREIFRLKGIDDHLATGVDSQVAFRLKADERISQRRVADAEFVADGRKIRARSRAGGSLPAFAAGCTHTPSSFPRRQLFLSRPATVPPWTFDEDAAVSRKTVEWDCGTARQCRLSRFIAR